MTDGVRASSVPRPDDRPIEDHAVIGDTRTAALVAKDGTVVWLCAPRFDSPPVFGALLAGVEGGRFSISPVGPHETSRRYRDGSAVLETEWAVSTGRARLTDGMVTDVSQTLLPQLLLARRLECLHGEAEFEISFDPRRDLREPPHRSRRRAGALVVEWGPLAVFLSTDPDLELVPAASRRLLLRAGEAVTFVVGVADRAPGVLVAPDVGWTQLGETDRWWRRWSSGIRYDGPSWSAVERSLITLRLLTYAPSGAPVASATTSLPEQIGGERNWDYRFSWPRDACLGTAAFTGVGKEEEAGIFLRWLSIASRLTRPAVDVLYDLDGRPGVKENERWDVPGYAGSLPVRVGNAACDQHQLDVYGWIVEAAWQFERGGRVLEPSIWRAVRAWVNFVCRHWRDPDAGIWERRESGEHFVHSKLMGWRALDRGLQLAERHGLRKSTSSRWRDEATALAADIFSKGVDPDRGVYLQRYGSPELDAALLMVADIGIEAPDAPRVRRTIDAIASELGAGDGLLYRYGSDEFGTGEGAFLACSFWMVRALALLGRTDQAMELFERLCGRANDVGLFAEEMDPQTGAHLGNFPQALTHSSLVQAALSLAPASGGQAADRA